MIILFIIKFVYITDNKIWKYQLNNLLLIQIITQSFNRHQQVKMLKYLAFCCSIIVIINAQKNDNVSPKVAKSVLHLGQNILKQVLLEKSVNVNTMEVISPLSIAGAISLVELGAIGQTYGELVQLMGQNECEYNLSYITYNLFDFFFCSTFHIIIC